MDAISAKRITKNLVFIKENVTQISKVMDVLIERDKISMEEKSDILTEKNSDAQCHILLETLIKRGGNSFMSFVEALRGSGNGHVADRIIQTDSQPGDKRLVQRHDTFIEIDTKTDEIIQLIKDRELFKLKYNELKTKYQQLKSDSENKSNDIEALNNKMETMQAHVSLVENKASKIESESKKWREVNSKASKMPQICKTHTDEIDSPSKAETDVVNDINPHDLITRLEQQTVTIEELTRNSQYYNNQVATLEDQIDELKATIAEKDDKIMKLRHSAGKLQIYIEATKHERQKVTSQFTTEMKENQKKNDERFDQLDDKMDCLLKLMNANKSPTKPPDNNTVLKSPRNQRQNKWNKRWNKN